MSKKIIIFILFFLIFQTKNFAQNEILIEGQIVNNIENTENIYIYNKRSNNFSLSNKDGLFSIVVKLNDTLIISGIQFIEKKIVVDKLKISKKKIIVELTEAIYELDEVLLKKNMTGLLAVDLKKIKDNSLKINAKSLNLPYSNTRKKTPLELKVYSLSYNMGPINNFINKISGRTKKNKKLIKILQKEEKIKQIFSSYSKFIYTDILNIPKDEIDSFINYCENDIEFLEIIKLKDELKILNFIINKRKTYNYKSITQN